MRKTIFALTIVFLAPTAVMASVLRGELVGNSESEVTIRKNPTALVGGVTTGQRGFSSGEVILAQGDTSGRGPGVGGQKGQKKGGFKGKQAKGKDNPNKAQGRDNPNKPR